LFHSRQNSETFDVLHVFLSLVVAKLSDLKRSPVFLAHPISNVLYDVRGSTAGFIFMHRHPYTFINNILYSVYRTGLRPRCYIIKSHHMNLERNAGALVEILAFEILD